jgi:hypothetical protein
MSYPATTTMHGTAIRHGRRSQRTSGASRGSWRARAAAAYRQAQPTMNADLRAEMAARLLALTGQAISPATIFVEPHTRTAMTVVDGVRFRLTQDELVMLRRCAYCGTGQFVSPALAGPTDLGYALTEWRPLHCDCAPEDPRE